MATSALTYGSLPEFDIKNSNWQNYARKLKYYFQANEIVSEEKKKAILLTVIGDETLSILCSLTSPEEPEKLSLEELLNKLANHFEPPSNETMVCFNFYTRQQNAYETITEYALTLRKLAQKCEFVDMDKQLRVRLVCGIRDDALRKRLLTIKNLTFNLALETALAFKTAEKNASQIAHTTQQISSPVSTPIHSHVTPCNVNDLSANKRLKPQKNSNANTENRACFRCGELHNPSTCPFLHSTCYYCKKVGHIIKVCRRRKKLLETNQNKPKNIISEISQKDTENSNELVQASTSLELFHLNNISTEADLRPVLVQLWLNGIPATFEVDSGCTYSVISKASFNELWPNKKPTLSRTDLTLRVWNNDTITVLGSVNINVKFQNQEVKDLPLLVVENGSRNLLGRNWFPHLGISINGLINLTSSVGYTEKFPSLFEENLGAVKTSPIHLELKDDAKAVFLRSRQVPLPLRSKIEETLNRMVADDILEPVQFSKWATPVVPILKRDGSLRLCMDYRVTVNPGLKTNVYPLPTISDILSTLTGSTTFSHLDMAQAYLQLPVDSDSAEILTINTHKGLFKMKRLPFGLSASPAIFQRYMETLLAGIPGLAIYLDDVVISGTDHKEHDQRLHEVLRRMSEAGLRLKKSKCHFDVSHIEFLGFRISREGISPTIEKVQAIHSAPEPRNKTELQSFLGLVNFYACFLKDKATVAEPLHRLLDKETPWKFGNNEKEAFQQLKLLLQSSDVLEHYHSDRELFLTCDASPVGVGAILSHKTELNQDRPIAYASRTLSSAERNYSQTDREGLAIMFGLKKFHRFIFGRHVTIITDHKPLLGLLNPKRPVPAVLSPRMLRWNLTMQAYDCELKYVPGNKIPNADALSRLPAPSDADEPEFPDPADVAMLESSEFPVSRQDIQEATRQDAILSEIIHCVQSGNIPSSQNSSYAPYRRRFEELSVQKQCLLLGNRVVIPADLRPRILQELHSLHPGIVTMKMLARGYAWWPGIDEDITVLVNTCQVCQRTRNQPNRAPPSQWEINHPWSRLHIDVMGPVERRSFLVVVDAYSRWVEVETLPASNSTEIITALRRIFASQGLPDTIVTDNGTIFTSSEFETFLLMNGIHHIRTPPFHPASNGQVERHIQSTKDTLNRMTTPDWETRLARFLLKQHATPNTATGKSPAELLQGRKLKTALDLILPSPRKPFREPAPASNLPVPNRPAFCRSFEPTDLVYALNFRKGEKWLPGSIVSKRGRKLYLVLLSDGRSVTRHIDQLRRRYKAR